MTEQAKAGICARLAGLALGAVLGAAGGWLLDRPAGLAKAWSAGLVGLYLGWQPAAVIVLAAGGGTRMKSKRSKLLHAVAGRPMLSYAVDAARALEPRRLVVVVGHLREQHLAELLLQLNSQLICELSHRGSVHDQHLIDAFTQRLSDPVGKAAAHGDGVAALTRDRDLGGAVGGDIGHGVRGSSFVGVELGVCVVSVLCASGAMPVAGAWFRCARGSPYLPRP